jgi:ribosomal protein S26
VGLVKGKHDAIIDQDAFDQVAQLLKKNFQRRKSILRNKHEYLLRGLVRCVHCGSVMTNYHSNGRGKVQYAYYRCVSVDKFGTTACKVRSVKARVLEEAIVERLSFLGEHPQIVENPLCQPE